MDGHVAVVTGAARGLGRAAAAALADEGVKVVLVARSTHETPNRLLAGMLEDVEQELVRRGAEAIAVPADVSQADAIERIVNATQERFGRCDVLVNNAAYGPVGRFLEVPPSRWNEALRVNVLAPVMLCHAFLPGMLERGTGVVLNIGSSAAVDDVPLLASYSVTKAALERLTLALEYELGGQGVAFNCVRIDEEIHTEANLLTSPALDVAAGDAERSLARPPVASGLTTPEQFGAAIAWLARQPTSFSGQILTLGRLRELGALPAAPLARILQ